MRLLSNAVDRLITLYESEHGAINNINQDQEECANLSKTAIETRYSPYI